MLGQRSTEVDTKTRSRRGLRERKKPEGEQCLIARVARTAQSEREIQDNNNNNNSCYNNAMSKLG